MYKTQLPASVSRARRADRPRHARRRRGRDGAGRGAERAAPEEPVRATGIPAGGDHRRRPRDPAAHLLQPGVAAAGPGQGPPGAVRRQGLGVQRQAPAGPPGLRAAGWPRRPGRGRRRIHWRVVAGLPREREVAVLDRPPVRPDPAGHPRRPRRPAAGRGARAAQPARPAGRVDRHPPTSHPSRRRTGQAPTQVGRGVRAPGHLGAAAGAGRLPATPRPGRADGLLAAFDARLPFALTGGQREVGELLAREIAADHPMHRLLQGEVGSGKTVVALRAMLAVVDAGGQAALLAPTEVLATQHLRSLRNLLGPLGCAGELGAADVATRVALITGSLGAAVRRQALADATAGQAGIVVGTHALLEEGVGFADLGLVVIDEQHRFGVEQRDALRAKGDRPPHVLVMTATPIPRTVAMTVYGDLETSTLTELPAGRATTQTYVVAQSRRRWMDGVWRRVRDEVAAGHQAFVVCPRIGDAAADEDATAAGEDADLDPPANGDATDGDPPARPPAAAVLE